MSIKKEIKTGQLQTRATIVANSYNAESRTIDVVFATETPVKRWNWDIGTYIEVLEISNSAINAERLDAGAQVLNSHKRYDLNDVLGVVIKHWIKDGEAWATLRFSDRPEIESIIKDIQSGIIRNISCGYSVEEYTVTEKEGSLAVYRATKWTPAEISFVPVPADHNSGTRSDDEKTSTNTTQIIRLMAKENTQTQEGSKATDPETKPTPVDTEQIRTQAIADERTRVSTINDACTRAGLDSEFAATLIKDGVTVDDARAQIIDKIAENANKAPVNVKITGEDEADINKRAIVIGLSARADYASAADDLKGNIKASEYRNMSLIDLAKSRLEAKGEHFRTLDNLEIARRAITTTDFPELLTATTERQLKRFYTSVVPEWKKFGIQDNVENFRAKAGLSVDAAFGFEKLTEGGEYKERKIIIDEKKTTKIDQYGQIITISERSIINDDMDVFGRLPKIIGVDAARFESNMFWGMIMNNQNTPDSKALFHADHKNLAASGAALSEDTLSAARLAIRRQVGPAKKVLGLMPKYLIVPAELETKAEKLLSAVLATATSDVNVMAGKFELHIADALTDPTAWFVAADPKTSNVDGLIYSYLNGREGISIDSQKDFKTNNLLIKTDLYFGVAAHGWQGWFKNPGA